MWGVLPLLFGCAMEVTQAEGDTEQDGPVSKVAQEISTGTGELTINGTRWTNFWSDWGPLGYEITLPHFPKAKLIWGAGNTYGQVTNDHEFPLQVWGRIDYTCSASQNWPYQVRGFLDVVPPGPDTPTHFAIAHGGFTWFSDCLPINHSFTLYYRPYRLETMVPFHDAFSAPRDDTGLFPDNVMRLDSRTPVARSNTMNVVKKSTLYIRYSHSHSPYPSGRIKVGIQNYDADGATVQAVNNVEFPVTPITSNWDKWDVVAVPLKVGSAKNVYVRLELQNSQTIYLDSAWVR